MSAEMVVLISAIIASLLDLITALVVVGAIYLLFQLACGIEWIILTVKSHRKAGAPDGAESEGEHA